MSKADWISFQKLLGLLLEVRIKAALLFRKNVFLQIQG